MSPSFSTQQNEQTRPNAPVSATLPEPQAHFGPRTFLSPDEISELSQLDAWRLAAALSFDFAVIVGAVTVSELVGHPAVYLIALMTIGARLTGIGSIALHEGVHQTLLKNRRWNDRLGSLLSLIVFTPLVTTFSGYRESHFGHHRGTNSDHDPDLSLMESFYRSRTRTIAAFVILLSGIPFMIGVLRFIIRDWKQQPIVTSVISGATAAISIGNYYDVYIAQLALWYWVVPFATWGIFVNQIRAFAEHYPEDRYGRNEVPDIFRTRDILNSWFDSTFIVTRGLNYHLSHHLCPQVPFYNLAKLQRKLAASPLYQRYSHVTRGYHRVVAEFLADAPMRK